MVADKINIKFGLSLFGLCIVLAFSNLSAIINSMSGNIDEQNEELEVLASIYPEEFQLLENNRCFKILLKPNPDGTDNYGTQWITIHPTMGNPPDFNSVLFTYLQSSRCFF